MVSDPATWSFLVEAVFTQLYLSLCRLCSCRLVKIRTGTNAQSFKNNSYGANTVMQTELSC